MMSKSLNKPLNTRSPGTAWKAFSGDRRGIIIVMFALMLPLIVGFIGLGVEVTYWFSKKRDLQAAADAGALAGSYELAEGRSASITTIATREAVSNGFSGAGIEVNNPPTNASSAYLNNDDAVEVELSMNENLMFAGWFLSGPVTINARAVGLSVAGASEACILALSSTASPALRATGSVWMTGCAAAANSTADDGVILDSSLSVDCVYSAGGFNGSMDPTYFDSPPGSNKEPTTTKCAGPKWGQPTATDPYADLSEPDTDALAACVAYVEGTSPNPLSASDGPFCGMSFTNGTLVMNAGTYYIDGNDGGSGLRITGNGTIDATAGVTIVFYDSGNGGDCGGIYISGNSDIDITAPDNNSGEPYPGITFYRGPSCDANDDFVFSGSNDSDIYGAIYNPSGGIQITGNGDVGGVCVQVIADTVTLTGSSTLGSTCGADSGVQSVSVGGIGSLVE